MAMDLAGFSIPHAHTKTHAYEMHNKMLHISLRILSEEKNDVGLYGIPYVEILRRAIVPTHYSTRYYLEYEIIYEH